MAIFKRFFQILLVFNLYILLYSVNIIKHTTFTTVVCFIFWFINTFTIAEILHSFYVKPKIPEKNSLFAEKMAKYYRLN